MKAALVGTGRVATQHLSCVSSLPGVTLGGVCDLSPAAAAATAERFGAPAFTDVGAMLAQVSPDVVHITTPAPTHFDLARRALEAGAHVLVEKPVAGSTDEVATLLELARANGRILVEDLNYVWDPAVVEVRDLVADGTLGAVRHVEVSIALDLFAAGSRYRDRDSPHPALDHPAGVVSEFVTHLASLAHVFIGPHTGVDTVWRRTGPDGEIGELRALVQAQRATAALSFSATSQPDDFTVRVTGTHMRASARLFDRRLTLTRPPPRARPRPIGSLANDLGESVAAARAGLAALYEKLAGGPGSYAGLWALVERTYESIARATPPPVSHRDIAEVNALVAAVVAGAPR